VGASQLFLPDDVFAQLDEQDDDDAELAFIVDYLNQCPLPFPDPA
jgi:hypothetical protein